MRNFAILFVCFVLVLNLVSCGGDAKTDVPEKDTVSVSETQRENDIPRRELTVIIDAGHGFDDPGSQPDMLCGDEADVTLAASNILSKCLSDKGIKFITTHDGKSFPEVKSLCLEAEKYGIEYDSTRVIDNNIFSAYERSLYAGIINARLSDCFLISLHTNTYDTPDIDGLSIDYYEGAPRAEVLERFSEDFAFEVKNKTGKDTVVWRDSFEKAFVVTKYSGIPSVLIEMGYGTNPVDAADLQNEEWLEGLCKIIAELCEKYEDELMN